jgi:hypothetical protein
MGLLATYAWGNQASGGGIYFAEPGIRIEGVTRKVIDGLDCPMAVEPRATLFINLGTAEGKND